MVSPMPLPAYWIHDHENAYKNEWKNRLNSKEIGTEGPLLHDTKVVVTKIGLDKWIAQGAGLDL